MRLAVLHMQLPLVAAVGVNPDDDQSVVNAKIDQGPDRPGHRRLGRCALSGRSRRQHPARLCCGKCGDKGHVVTGLNMPMLVKLATADRSTGPAALGSALVLTGTKSIHVE